MLYAANLFFSESDVCMPPAVCSLVCMKEISAMSIVSKVHEVLQLSGWNDVNDLRYYDTPTRIQTYLIAWFEATLWRHKDQCGRLHGVLGRNE